MAEFEAPPAPKQPVPVIKDTPETPKPEIKVEAKAPLAARVEKVAKAHDEDEVDGLKKSEREAIMQEVRRKLTAEKHKTAMEKYREKIEYEMRLEEGLIEGGADNEIVNITIDLAKHSDRLLVDQRAFFHGQTYPVTRRTARSLMEMMYHGWRHQYEIDGKTRVDFYAARRETKVTSTRTLNAPRRADA